MSCLKSSGIHALKQRCTDARRVTAFWHVGGQKNWCLSALEDDAESCVDLT